MDKIVFMATLPQIQSAIKVDGVEGSARIQLDIPGTEIAALTKLIAFGRGKVLKITVEQDV